MCLGCSIINNISPTPHFLQGLGSSPVSSQHYPENRNFVDRQRDSRRGFSQSGCLHHYRGTQGGTKITQEECLCRKWFEVASGQLLSRTVSESCRNYSPVFCAFPWWCWCIWAGILTAAERAITAAHQRAGRAMRVYKRQYLVLFIQQSEKSFIFWILSFRRVPYVICFLLGIYPASQC